MTKTEANTLPVILAPMFDPASRMRLEVPEGSTIADIVAVALPGANDEALEHTRVTLSTEKGVMVVDRERWPWVRPKAGVTVVVRVVPGNDSLRTVLMVLVSVAAIAAGQIWGPALAEALHISTAAAAGIIGLGVSPIGALQVDGLRPSEAGS